MHLVAVLRLFYRLDDDNDDGDDDDEEGETAEAKASRLRKSLSVEERLELVYQMLSESNVRRKCLILLIKTFFYL